MAHPQEVSVEQRAKGQHLSPLMRAKAKAKTGEKVNACPYGCGIENLDDHGYCRHLVGFTTDGKFYEPMIRVRGKRVVRPKMVVDEVQMGNLVEEEEYLDPQDGLYKRRQIQAQPIMKPVLEEVQPKDKLVRITVSSRVYRDVDGMGAKIEAQKQIEEKKKRAEERRLLIDEIKNDPEARESLLEALSDPKQLTTVG